MNWLQGPNSQQRISHLCYVHPSHPASMHLLLFASWSLPNAKMSWLHIPSHSALQKVLHRFHHDCILGTFECDHTCSPKWNLPDIQESYSWSELLKQSSRQTAACRNTSTVVSTTSIYECTCGPLAATFTYFSTLSICKFNLLEARS